MKKRAYIYINYANIVVLQVYLDVIKDAFTQIGYECEYIKTLDGVSKSDLVVFPMAKDAFKYYWKGYCNFVLWQQGATGAESYMRHSSKARKAVLDFMDCFAMKKAKMVFYVSQYMKAYYERMARTSFAEKAYVMPCFNEKLDSKVFERKDYSKKTFTYVGSLDLWQCFDETAEMYARIEKALPDTFFKVLTFNVDKAEQILKEKNVRRYSVACVPKEQVTQELEEATFGFVLRRDVDVNRVATPTKLSSYLSAGVLPVYSSCLKDFHEQAKNKAFAYALNLDESANVLIGQLGQGVDKNVVQREIEDLFDTYYSAEYHARRIADLAEKCL